MYSTSSSFSAITRSEDVSVERIKPGRLFALDIVPPVADEVLLREDGPIRAEEAVLATVEDVCLSRATTTAIVCWSMTHWAGTGL